MDSRRSTIIPGACFTSRLCTRELPSKSRRWETTTRRSLYRLDNMASLYTSLLLLCFDGVHKTSLFKRKPNGIYYRSPYTVKKKKNYNYIFQQLFILTLLHIFIHTISLDIMMWIIFFFFFYMYIIFQ